MKDSWTFGNPPRSISGCTGKTDPGHLWGVQPAPEKQKPLIYFTSGFCHQQCFTDIPMTSLMMWRIDPKIADRPSDAHMNSKPT